MYKSVVANIRTNRLLHDVMLELTFDCNLDCFYCYNDKNANGKPLSLDQYRVLFDDLERMQVLGISLTGGEPMAHPHFFEIGKMARERGFVVRIKSNGHALRSNAADRIKQEMDPLNIEMSLHGATPQTHDRQTRVEGSFERLISNTRYMKSIGLRTSLITTPTAWNWHEFEQMIDLAEELGVRLSMQGPVAPRDNGDNEPLEIQPTEEQWDAVNAIARRRQLGGRNQRETLKAPTAQTALKYSADKVPKNCGSGLDSLVIDPFGEVLTCLHLRWSGGNLHVQDIVNIWNHAPVFRNASDMTERAFARFGDQQPSLFGARTFCPAVEINSGCGGCGGKCGGG